MWVSNIEICQYQCP
ncbi:unnamed protein product, partial [Tilletia laevis]